MGTHVKTSWDSKGTAVPLARGHPIGARSALLAGESKGDSVPLGGGFQRRQRCLGGRHPMEGSALRGRKNPMKPAVSWHTTLFAKSSVLYLLRPLPLERGCLLTEHTVSSGCRTGGFWRATGRNSGFVPQAKSDCSGVGGVAERR